MESQTLTESQQEHATKGELDQNMNSTVALNDCKPGQLKQDNLTTQEAVTTELKPGNTQFDTEQTSNAVKPDTQLSKNSGDVTKSDENILHSEFEQSYTSAEDTTSNGVDDVTTADDTNSFTEENSTDKLVSSLPQTSILAAELMSDSSYLASNNTYNRSATASPQSSTGSFKASPEVVSTSKTSSSKKIKQRRRGSAWTDDETDFLMEVWAQQSELMKQKGGDESVTCAPVYRLISRSMAELGFDKSWEQCKTRIHTLKRAYKITKDEIDNGAQTITYCRHFDKLEIINGDNAQITPGMLASGLEQQRKQRDVRVSSGKKQPVKRKLTVGENPNLVKRNNGSPVIPTSGIIPKLLAQAPALSVSGTPGQTQNSSSSNMTWYPPQMAQPPQQQQQQLKPQQQQFLSPNSSTVQQAPLTSIHSLTPPPAQTAPAYSYQQPTPPPPYCSTTIATGQNVVSIKPELSDNPVLDQYSMISSSTNRQTTQTTTLQSGVVPATSSTGSDIERMRLDLELRKLEVERNKIEMEERQRREDRDHQYRMMQLLMFGLGQQNNSQQSPGHVSDVANAHTSADIMRALENGLVPGWSQKVNEKGLSFSEL